MVNYDTRPYSPSLARFISRDTIGEQGGLNLYAYVLNNPANHYDVLGMSVGTLGKYVSLYGEQGNTGQSTGGLSDTSQAWVSMGTVVDNGGETLNGTIREVLQRNGATRAEAVHGSELIRQYGFQNVLNSAEAEHAALNAHIATLQAGFTDTDLNGFSAKEEKVVTVTDNGRSKKVTLTDNGHKISSPEFQYNTAGMDSAAVQVLSFIGPISKGENVEYAGEIYSPWFSSKLMFTQPLTANMVARSVTWANTPFFASTAALYHTHSGDSNGGYLDEYYSRKDLRNAGNKNVPSYLYAPSGNIYKFSTMSGVSKWNPQSQTFEPTGWKRDSATGMYLPPGNP